MSCWFTFLIIILLEKKTKQQAICEYTYYKKLSISFKHSDD